MTGEQEINNEGAVYILLCVCPPPLQAAERTTLPVLDPSPLDTFVSHGQTGRRHTVQEELRYTSLYSLLAEST